MRPATHIWDTLIPILALTTAGGVVAFFIWKLTRSSTGAGMGGTSTPPKPKEIGPPGFRYKTAKEFMRDRDEGKDLDVRPRR